MLFVHAELWDIVANPPENYTAAQAKASQKALALLVFNVSTSLIPVLRMCTNAAEAWHRLETLYAAVRTVYNTYGTSCLFSFWEPLNP